MNIVEIIKNKVGDIFSDSNGSHDLDHTFRVYNMCIHIGKKENADMEILQVAALLHDVGRVDEDNAKGKICHAEIGAKKAEKILIGLNVEKDKIAKIVHCIESHRFRGNKIPVSKEAKILFDADKLDSIGAVGIGRAFLFAGENSAKLHNNSEDALNAEEYSKEDTAYREYLVKLRKVKDRMLTTEGKRIAEERHRFMLEFFERMNEEVEGKL